MPLRIVLAEDNLLVRAGVTSLLSTYADVDLVAACGDPDELLAAVEAERPDVVLTDIRMPPTHTDEGIRVARRLRRTAPDTGVVVLSQFVEPAYALDLFADGSRGRGYLLKDHVDDVDRLVSAVRTVAAGGSYIDDDVVDALVRARRRSLDSPLAALSTREADVLAELATGASNAAIARSLGVSEHSVEKHTGVIFAKLGLSGDADVNRRVTAVLLFLAGREPHAASAEGH
ncbi:MAG TPA: response regulator transcription factor [Acidimicrobiales bacterium]|jgi:DNA-binding NarL/FixJ family response regulator